MKVSTMAELAAMNEQPEILFWVGCAGSFDQRAQKITKALCIILQKAGIQFAILGKEEMCTGDPARRSGNEFLFQMMAYQNIQVLNGYGVKKIVTSCPHCFNTLKNEYPALGGTYEVIHHTTLIQQLMLEGKIVVKKTDSAVTYHDSCYLGRMNNVYAAPRAVLDALYSEIKEMKRCKSDGLCCGAGGAQMFKEEENGKTSVNHERMKDVINTGVSLVATACPFCNTMLTDGAKSHEKEDSIQIKDIAELVAAAL